VKKDGAREGSAEVILVDGIGAEMER
jgi:hypothetical protein